jgi:hemoglobin/transferrin/lactoferrin receptor protein
VLTTLPGLNFSAHISRGFRTPHITDFGTLGITGSGFEVAAPDVANLNATIGSTADRNAVNTGVAVTQLKPESSLSYDFGAHYKHKRIDADVVFFVNNIHDNIAKQTLILPPGAVGKTLGDQAITSQLANGAVFVAASTNPVLVRTNFENARYVGLEQMFEYKLTTALTFAQNFTYIHSKDLHTGLAPNIEGGTPAPQGWLRLRYQAANQRFWFEPYVSGSLRNTRLSSLDLEDRRTGAFRSRGNMQNFFRNGATARGLIAAGADGRFGTADDILKITNETLAQVQDRVLGVGVAGAALFRAIPGFMTFNLRGGVRFNERHEMTFDLENLTDRNYRGISWGLDAPGRGGNVRYSYRF